MGFTEKEILEIIQEIHCIPHLELPLKFDVEKMQAEVRKISKWYPHVHANYAKTSQQHMNQYTIGYSGVSLFEYNAKEDYLTDNYEIYDIQMDDAIYDYKTQKIIFPQTPLAKKLPYLSSVIETISLRSSRTRIMKSEPNHSIAWHSHNRGPWFNDHAIEAIVHVPIITNPKVFHTVRDYRANEAKFEKGKSSSLESLTQNPNNFIQNYSEGSCWLFNPWHDHYFHNYGSKDRYTLLAYVRWSHNDTFLRLVKSALDQYSGPRIKIDFS